MFAIEKNIEKSKIVFYPNMDEEAILVHKGPEEKFIISGNQYEATEEISTQKIFDNFKGSTGFINIKWAKQYDIYGSILNINEDDIIVECMMDEDRNIFKKMIFPIDLLSNLKNLNEGSLIVVRVSENPGTRQYQFFNGEGIYKAEKIFKYFDMDIELDKIPLAKKM